MHESDVCISIIMLVYCIPDSIIMELSTINYYAGTAAHSRAV